MAQTETSIRWLTDEEARTFFERQSQRWLNLSTADFLAAYDRGDYRSIDDDDRPNSSDVLYMISLIPLVR